MKRPFFLMTPVLASILLSACGSGTHPASNGGGGKTTPAAATTSSGGGGAYGGGYGGSSSAAPSSSSPAASNPAGPPASGSSAAVQVTTKPSKLGTILAAGSKQLTVYLFEGDRGSASTCAGPCASAWPPVTTGAKPAARGQAVSADLGTITRSGGAKQVTYKGHPLYYFVRDKDHGDAYGEGVKAFGAGWYVVAPNGRKVDNS